MGVAGWKTKAGYPDHGQMKSVSANLATHIAGETTTLAYLFRITRTDGVIKRFTTHDVDITYSGFVFESSASFSALAIQTTAGLEVDNTDIDVLIDSAGITEADIMAGLYDFAVVEIFQVNYMALGDGQLNLRKGRLGEVSIRRGVFGAELRGLTQHLQQTIGRIYQRKCDADLGDARCLINLAPFTVTGTVTLATSRQVFTVSSAPTLPGGKLTWTSGLNNGFGMEVKTIAGSVITLFLAMPYDVAIGDAYTVFAGCDKKLSTCRDVFNNVINFRGHGHYIPGSDYPFRYPDAHA